MKKQQDKNNPPEEWELTLTLEPEEEEQPKPGDGSALTDEDILRWATSAATWVAKNKKLSPFGALCYTESTKGDFYARI